MEGTPYAVLARSSRMGRSTITIRCPFCATQFEAFVWSLAGGGKRCPTCRAFHGSYGAYTAEAWDAHRKKTGGA